MEERVEGGFPDDRDAAGPTVISTETLSEVAHGLIGTMPK